MVEALTGLIQTASKIGSLSTATILALLCIGMGFYIYRKAQSDALSSESWRLTRESAIVAETKQTLAVNGMTDQIKTLSEAILEMSTKIERNGFIIEERLPKR